MLGDVCLPHGHHTKANMSHRQVVLDLRSGSTPIRTLLADLRAHRDLLPLLARQHFHGQYRAARLGVAWAAAQPLLRGAILALIFTRVAPDIDTGPVPYAAFVLTGTVTFQYIAGVLTAGTTVIASSSDLAGKVYFPRLLLAAVPASSGLLGYLVGLGIVIPLTFAFGVRPSWHLLALPVPVLLVFALVVSATAVLGLWHVYWRDLGPLVTAVVSIGFYLTPVIYPASELEGPVRLALELNPATGAIAAMRWAVFGGHEPGLARPLAFTIAWTLVLTVVALLAYRRYERVCVDRL